MSKRFVLIVLLGFCLSFPFQYLLIPTVTTFVDIPRITATFFISLIDVLFLVFVYWVFKLHTKTNLKLREALSIVIIAIITVTIVEWLATTVGIWKYKETVVVVPYLLDLHFGALAQYTIVPILTLYIAIKNTKPL